METSDNLKQDVLQTLSFFIPARRFMKSECQFDLKTLLIIVLLLHEYTLP